MFETPIVDPSDDQILVNAGVNATDISAGRYGSDGTLPFDAGLEGIGVIEVVGKNVNTNKPGDPGIILGKPAYSEYAYVKPDEFIGIPVVKPELIALLVCGLTASIGLDHCGRLKKDDKVKYSVDNLSIKRLI